MAHDTHVHEPASTPHPTPLDDRDADIIRMLAILIRLGGACDMSANNDLAPAARTLRREGRVLIERQSVMRGIISVTLLTKRKGASK